jgi:hypothetical protein
MVFGLLVDLVCRQLARVQFAAVLLFLAQGMLQGIKIDYHILAMECIHPVNAYLDIVNGAFLDMETSFAIFPPPLTFSRDCTAGLSDYILALA